MPDKFQVLTQYFGYTNFREGQEHLIDHILNGHDVLGVMPTGAGKSICFQVPAMVMEGITLVISPLISLMKDQVNALTQAGIKAAYLNSSLSMTQYSRALQNAIDGEYSIIYVAPERLLTDDFLSFAANAKIAMLTVDEAHCISQWGQDFRPSYTKIVEFIDSLPTRPIVSAFTATATGAVRDDIIMSLHLIEPEVLVTGFDRPNLYFEVQKPKNKLAALTDYLRDKSGKTGVIYCSTRKNVETVCDCLNDEGFEATRYHAGLTDSERKQNQDDFIFDRAQIMVATNAFGMGIDKSNVSFVVHFNMPKNIESYYQEAGRAGRDGENAECILFYSGQDVRTNQFFIDNNRDTEFANKETEQLVKEREGERLKQMTFYCFTNDCLREFILKYFGEKSPNFCGNCGSCNTNFSTVDITVMGQKILSCISRTRERFGVKLIVDTLRGSKNDRIQKLGLDKISTYNIMNDSSDKQIRDVISYLLLKDYLVSTNDEFPIIKLGARAGEVLFQKNTIEMKLAKEYEKPVKSERKSTGSHAVDNELFKLLKQLRLKLAQEQNMPAYTIFSDSSLVDMCMKLPTNDREFKEVSGVGNVKLERYGAAFMEIISNFTGGKPSPIPTETVKAVSPITFESTDEPVTVSTLADRISIQLMQKGGEKVSAIKLGVFLVAEGYLQVSKDESGKSVKGPTALGTEIGIVSAPLISKRGDEYISITYNKSAQETVVNKYLSMCEEDGDERY